MFNFYRPAASLAFLNVSGAGVSWTKLQGQNPAEVLEDRRVQLVSTGFYFGCFSL